MKKLLVLITAILCIFVNSIEIKAEDVVRYSVNVPADNNATNLVNIIFDIREVNFEVKNNFLIGCLPEIDSASQHEIDWYVFELNGNLIVIEKAGSSFLIYITGINYNNLEESRSLKWKYWPQAVKCLLSDKVKIGQKAVIASEELFEDSVNNDFKLLQEFSLSAEDPNENYNNFLCERIN